MVALSAEASVLAVLSDVLVEVEALLPQAAREVARVAAMPNAINFFMFFPPVG